MDAYVGEIKLWTANANNTNRCPENWMPCNGQLLDINTYEVLYSLIGTAYGGDGIITFGLPNLQTRAIVSKGIAKSTTVYNLGQTGGAEIVTLTTANLPTHNHTVKVSTDNATVNTAANNFLAAPIASGGSTAPVLLYADTAKAINGVTVTPSATDPSSVTTAAGGNQPHNNLMPYITMCYIICVNGIYPEFNN
jgi:microcystin-dependent protein